MLYVQFWRISPTIFYTHTTRAPVRTRVRSCRRASAFFREFFPPLSLSFSLFVRRWGFIGIFTLECITRLFDHFVRYNIDGYSFYFSFPENQFVPFSVRFRTEQKTTVFSDRSVYEPSSTTKRPRCFRQQNVFADFSFQ